jgi:membrane-associated phospholipid phosphatase
MRLPSLCALSLCAVRLAAGSAAPAGPGPAAPAAAAASDPDRFRHLPRLVLDDARAVVTAPSRWDQGDWLLAGAGAAAVLGAGLLLDRPVARAVDDHARPSWDRWATRIQKLGGTPSIAIAGGTYLAGVAFENPEVRATGVDLMATMGIAQLLVTLPLKTLAGRSRPDAGQGTHDFQPLTGGSSFPSGHTTQAFALASVISAHAGTPWVTGLSYGLAGLVGLARVEQKQHFLSDVVAGGLIGTCVGRTVVRTNQALRAQALGRVQLSWTPTLAPGAWGFTLAARF